MSKYFTLAFINPSQDNIIYNSAIKRSVKAGVISIIPIRSDKLLLNLLNGQSLEIILSSTPLELNEKFVNSLTKLILNQIEIVKATPTSQGLEQGDYHERKPGSIKATIASLLYKWKQDLETKKISVLEIAIDLMIRLVRGHFLSNGNKRLGIISCGAFLASVGLYLKWNSNKVKYLNHWEKLMLEIAEGKISKDIDEIKEKLNLHKIFSESIYLSTKWIEN